MLKVAPKLAVEEASPARRVALPKVPRLLAGLCPDPSTVALSCRGKEGEEGERDDEASPGAVLVDDSLGACSGLEAAVSVAEE